VTPHFIGSAVKISFFKENISFSISLLAAVLRVRASFYSTFFFVFFFSVASKNIFFPLNM
jgi:hypothetical protein